MTNRDSTTTADRDHSRCCFSVDFANRITAGRGKLAWNGEWEFPCIECAERAQRKHDEAETTIMEMVRKSAWPCLEETPLMNDTTKLSPAQNYHMSDTTAGAVGRVSEEIEAARHHLYIALGSISILTDHLSNASGIGTHIKQALAMLPRRGEINDA